MNWKYTDETRTVVYRVNADNSMESKIVSCEEFQKWLAEGNTPDEPNNKE